MPAPSLVDAKHDGNDLHSPSYKPLAMLVGCAFFMEQLDATIIAPAIPAMAKAFAVEPLQLNLAMTLYLLLLVVFVPISGALADRFGTRRVFSAAVTIFTLSSLACGFAHSLPTLLLARSLQGIGAALMVPVGRMAMVRATRPADLVAAMAWMVTPAMIGPLLGPPLGGVLVTWLSWPWIFWANVPIGIVGLYLTQRLVPQFAVTTRRRIDLLGWLILSLGVGCLVIGLDLSHAKNNVAHLAPVLLIVALLCVFAYWLYSRHHPNPLLDFSLARITTFRVSLVSGTLVRVGYGALPFLLPLTLQLGMGMSPMQSGLVIAGSALASMLMKTATVKILRYFGFRSVLIANGLLCAVGLAVCALLGPGWSAYATLCLLLISGISRSVQFNALGSIAYADTRREQTGAATSLNTTFQQLAAAIGIALSAWLLNLFAGLSGDASPTLHSYAWTYLALALIALLAVPVCLQLKGDAGKALTGG
ncbi:MFS transporter [Pseudomonas typographi]|uniref:MFS transporter n=1 Tax=Pseudomonas typographi TaxID=2715964 RepID=A0ABR7YYF6_9PSED|nr:MFS transporter [Pseudomonas typographi]MBD1550750.1 MFS transporter [Pseudomonas typographi]MBD1587692.1 MFS transporter [Pseudomonas typographi]MBD1598215.1 MFS transporter [Pseudomonas typographi]